MADRQTIIERLQRSRYDLGLAMNVTTDAAGPPVGTRIRALVGEATGQHGIVRADRQGVLPRGQIIVEFPEAIVGNRKWFAFLPSEIEPIN